MTNEQGAIEERLEKLERQNRRMRLAGLGALLIAGAFVLMGQASRPRTQTVRAKSFVLVDANGMTRARLHMSAVGLVLSFYDAEGVSRAGLSVMSDGPVLALNDANGKPRVWLSVSSEGPLFNLFDAKGESRAALSVSSDGPVEGVRLTVEG